MHTCGDWIKWLIIKQKMEHGQFCSCDLSQTSCLWLFADGLHKNMMTSRMIENKNLQKASSTHSSIQSFTHKQTLLSICQTPKIDQVFPWLPCTRILTDWQSASRNFFAVQPIKMMEAWGKNGQRWDLRNSAYMKIPITQNCERRLQV